MTEAYPLCWPLGWHRTSATQRREAQFKTTLHRAARGVAEEVARLGGKHLVISSNVPVRRDGLPYSDWDRRRIDDPGVAVYFTLDGVEQCIPCDKWLRVEHNLQAVRKTIEALRGIERWGAKDMVAAAFKGFAALPPPSQDPNWWRDYLGFKPGEQITQQMVNEAFGALAKVYHPDIPGTGDKEKFINLQAARACAMQQVVN